MYTVLRAAAAGLAGRTGRGRALTHRHGRRGAGARQHEGKGKGAPPGAPVQWEAILSCRDKTQNIVTDPWIWRYG